MNAEINAIQSAQDSHQRDAAPGVGNSPTCNESLQVATLSTAKPPLDLRTKVPAVAEIREDV